MSVRCRRCGRESKDTEQCSECGLIFRDYEKDKQACIAEVYSLISRGDLEAAKSLAEESGKQFPDSRSDFLLLLSNINRDISIVQRYEEALAAFDQGDFNKVILLLRNIKAFDQVLDGKVISLRRKAERFNDHAAVFTEAVEHFDQGDYAQALELFKKIDGYARQDEVDSYLEKIDGIKNVLFQEAVDLVVHNRLESARRKFDELHGVVPGMEAQTAPYLALIEKKTAIKENLLALAGQARQEGRLVEAKVIYSYLCWQWPDQYSRLVPYLEEIGARAEIHLRDSADQGLFDCSALGLVLDKNGFFVAASGQADGGQDLWESCPGTAVPSNPEPLVDILPAPVDIDGEGVADFTY